MVRHLRLRLATAALLLGLAACGQQPAAPPAEQPPASSAAASPVSSPALTAPASAPSSAAPAAPSAAPASTPAPSLAPATPAPQPPAIPTRLRIPAINVDAAVEQLGEAPDGSMEAPTKWEDVGWFDRGFLPGQPGSAVIAGHLDSTTDRAVFWDLGRLKPNDEVIVDMSNQTELHFTVLSQATYPYDKAPLQQIFGPASKPLLNLVTCHGTFDRASSNYDQRLVVYTQETGT